MVFDFLKKQFIDVIEWNEEGDDELAVRVPMRDQEIQNGAELTVRETQAALFVNEGKVADLFGPGQFRLTTRTLPLLTNLKNWDKLFASPFKSDVYFFSTRHRVDRKWGTPQPISVRDKEFGPIRVRAFAAFSYKISDPRVMFKKLSGTRDVFTMEDLEGQLRAVITTNFAPAFVQTNLSFLDMAANQLVFSQKLREGLAAAFEEYGLNLESFNLQNVSLPEDLQEKFDKVAGMRMVGDLDDYTKYQTAESIPAAAANPGGVAGAGAGLAAGMVMGQQMMNSMQGGAKASGEQDVLQQIEKVHELMKKGIITQAEFDAKKTELLKKIK